MELNPYSPPVYELTDHSPNVIRPSKAASWLYWMIRGGNGPARRDPRTGKIMLSASFLPLLFTFCSMVLAPIMVMTLATIYPPAMADSSCPMYLVTLFEVIGILNLVSVFACGQVAVTKHSIQVHKPFSYRMMSWRDIAFVRLLSNGSVVLESFDHDTTITVDSCMAGLGEFADILERLLPGDVRTECQAELDSYRQFIGSTFLQQSNRRL